MKINGNLIFNADATGELRNVFIERLPSAPDVDLAQQKGRIYFNTTTGLYYFSDGTAWQPFSVGGNATLLQQYLNNVIASIGNAVNSDGTWNGTAAFNGVPVIAGATSITNALTLLANEAAASSALSELDDVALTTLQSGQFLRYNGTNWANHTLALADVSDVTATAAEVNVLSGIPATLTSTELGYVDGVTSPIQNQLDSKQPLDATLTALAGLNGTGIVVETGADVFNHRSLVAPAAGITIQNADGVNGNPTFALANDLAALEGLSSFGYIVRTSDGTATTRAIAGQPGRIVVTDGDGIASNTDIDLAMITQGSTGNFVKVTLDSYGRVVGNTPVVLSDIKALADGEYVNAAGDAMSGNLDMAGNRITGLGTPVNGTDATNKNYVDALAAGLTWKNAVRVMADVNVDVAVGGLLTIDGQTLNAGDRVLLTAQTADSEKGIWVAAAGPWTRAADADAFDELNGAAVFVQEGTNYADTAWTQTTTLTSFAGQTWVQFAGANTYVAGVGLDLTGNTFSVNLGAGIFEGPSDAVGIDLYSPDGGALMLTNDGSNRASPLDLNSKLHLKLAANGGLTQDATGLYIPNNGITNAMILNSTMGLNADAGSGTLALGDTLLIFGDSIQGINTSVAGSAFQITALDASYTQKGVASFDGNIFSVNAGAVSIMSGGIDNDKLATPYITFNFDYSGNRSVDLGDTVAFTDDGPHNDANYLVKIDIRGDKTSINKEIGFSIRYATDSHPGVARFNQGDFTVGAGVVYLNNKNLNWLTDVNVSAEVNVGDTLVYSGGSFRNRSIYYLYDGSTVSTTHTVNHNIGQKYCNVTVVDDMDEVIIPESIIFNDNYNLTVTFTAPTKCKVIVMGVNTNYVPPGV